MNEAGAVVTVNFGGQAVVSVGIVDRIQAGAEYVRLLSSDEGWMDAQHFTGGVSVVPLEQWPHAAEDPLRFCTGDVGFSRREGEAITVLSDADGNEVARLLTLQVHFAQSDVGKEQKDPVGQAIFNVRTYAGAEGVTMAADAYQLLTVPDVLALVRRHLPLSDDPARLRRPL